MAILYRVVVRLHTYGVHLHIVDSENETICCTWSSVPCTHVGVLSPCVPPSAHDDLGSVFPGRGPRTLAGYKFGVVHQA